MTDQQQHPPPTPRFPPRGLPAGAVSQCYTPAEQRMIAYVNAVVRQSDMPGSELREAAERILAIDAPYWEFKEREWNHKPATSSTIYPGSRQELDERTEPGSGPKPIRPEPATPGGDHKCLRTEDAMQAASADSAGEGIACEVSCNCQYSCAGK